MPSSHDRSPTTAPAAFDTAPCDPPPSRWSFDLAIGVLDSSAGDFETVLRPALAARGAALLFVLPCPVTQNASRLAAASLGPARQIVLVVLDATGVEQPATENPFAGLVPPGDGAVAAGGVGVGGTWRLTER